MKGRLRKLLSPLALFAATVYVCMALRVSSFS